MPDLDLAKLREKIVWEIATLLDHPSVYMGGPSARSRARAEKIANTFLTAIRPALQAAWEACADDLRAAGWSVAVHNDYRLNGEPHTFWLFTHPDGRWIKGEGRTDAEALTACRTALIAQAEAGAEESAADA